MAFLVLVGLGLALFSGVSATLVINAMVGVPDPPLAGVLVLGVALNFLAPGVALAGVFFCEAGGVALTTGVLTNFRRGDLSILGVFTGFIGDLDLDLDLAFFAGDLEVDLAFFAGGFSSLGSGVFLFADVFFSATFGIFVVGVTFLGGETFFATLGGDAFFSGDGLLLAGAFLLGGDLLFGFGLILVKASPLPRSSGTATGATYKVNEKKCNLMLK